MVLGLGKGLSLFDPKLGELADVNFTSLTNGQIPTYQSSTQTWINSTGGGSGTVITTGSPVSGNLTEFSSSTSITNGDLSGDVTTSGTLATTLKSNLRLGTVGFGTSRITGVATGQVPSYVTCPYSGTITAWDAAVDAGTVTFKVWKVASGTASPTSANSINTSGVGISTGTAIHSTTLSDFTTTTVTAGDIFGCQITAVATATIASLQLEISKT